MNRFHSRNRVAVVIAGLALTSLAPAAQTRPPAPASSAPKALARTPDGKPELEGVWNFANITPLERPARFAEKEFLTEAEAAAVEAAAAANRVDRAPRPGDPGTYNQFW